MESTFNVTADHAFGGESRPFTHWSIAVIYARQLAKNGYENVKIWNGRAELIFEITAELTD